MSKETKKKNLGQIIYVIIMLLAGMACGVAAGRFVGRASDDSELVGFMLVLLVGMYLAIFVQIAAHEAGHLVFGLISGYKFSSYRIGSLMFLKEDGKIVLRKYSLAGTGGQCLMSPPDLVDGKIPVILYNLGGCLMNLIVSVVFAVLAYLSRENEVVFIISASMVVMGVAFALTNGIPMQMGMVSNDGSNAFSLGKNPVALKAFWTQLKVNEQLSKGKRLKEMPTSWFAVSEDKDMDNALVAAIAVFHANRLMDQLKIEKAAEYIEQLLRKETGILGLHRNLLICEQIYCELVGKRNISEAIYLHNKAYSKFVKQMKNTPNIIRSEYAYALIAEKDEKKAKKLLARFEKVAKTYPYPREIEGERELMELVKRSEGRSR